MGNTRRYRVKSKKNKKNYKRYNMSDSEYSDWEDRISDTEEPGTLLLGSDSSDESDYDESQDQLAYYTMVQEGDPRKNFPDWKRVRIPKSEREKNKLPRRVDRLTYDRDRQLIQEQKEQTNFFDYGAQDIEPVTGRMTDPVYRYPPTQQEIDHSERLRQGIRSNPSLRVRTIQQHIQNVSQILEHAIITNNTKLIKKIFSKEDITILQRIKINNVSLIKFILLSEHVFNILPLIFKYNMINQRHIQFAYDNGLEELALYLQQQIDYSNRYIKGVIIEPQVGKQPQDMIASRRRRRAQPRSQPRLDEDFSRLSLVSSRRQDMNPYERDIDFVRPHSHETGLEKERRLAKKQAKLYNRGIMIQEANQRLREQRELEQLENERIQAEKRQQQKIEYDRIIETQLSRNMQDMSLSPSDRVRRNRQRRKRKAERIDYRRRKMNRSPSLGSGYESDSEPPMIESQMIESQMIEPTSRRDQQRLNIQRRILAARRPESTNLPRSNLPRSNFEPVQPVQEDVNIFEQQQREADASEQFSMARNQESFNEAVRLRRMFGVSRRGYTLVELRKYAKDNNITGYSRYKKRADLINYIIYNL